MMYTPIADSIIFTLDRLLDRVSWIPQLLHSKSTINEVKINDVLEYSNTELGHVWSKMDSFKVELYQKISSPAEILTWVNIYRVKFKGIIPKHEHLHVLRESGVFEGVIHAITAQKGKEFGFKISESIETLFIRLESIFDALKALFQDLKEMANPNDLKTDSRESSVPEIDDTELSFYFKEKAKAIIPYLKDNYQDCLPGEITPMLFALQPYLTFNLVKGGKITKFHAALKRANIAKGSRGGLSASIQKYSDLVNDTEINKAKKKIISWLNLIDQGVTK